MLCSRSQPLWRAPDGGFSYTKASQVKEEPLSGVASSEFASHVLIKLFPQEAAGGLGVLHRYTQLHPPITKFNLSGLLRHLHYHSIQQA